MPGVMQNVIENLRGRAMQVAVTIGIEDLVVKEKAECRRKYFHMPVKKLKNCIAKAITSKMVFCADKQENLYNPTSKEENNGGTS